MRRDRITVIQSVAVSVVLVAAALYVLNLPVLYVELQQICDSCMLTVATHAELEALGWGTSSYALYLLFLSLSFAMGNVILAALIFKRRPNDPMALLVAATLALFGLTLTVTQPFHEAFPSLSLVARGIGFVAMLLMGSVICYFPDFRTAPRWSHLLAIGYLLVEVLVNFDPTFMKEPVLPEWLLQLLEWMLLLAMGVTQIFRYNLLSTPLQRQQTKLPAFAFVIAILLIITSVQIPMDSLFGNLFGQTLYMMALMLIPLSFAVAIIRYRLWSIDPLINRAFLYGALTGILMIVYTSIVFILGTVFQSQSITFISLVGTVAIAVVVYPLHRRLQTMINRLMYGDRDDPYAAIVRLGDRLEATTSPERVLDTIATSVRDALRLPYVALVWPDGRTAASSGTPSLFTQQTDVIYQGERVAELIVEPRDKDDEWSKHDQQVLTDLARQAGAAIYAIRLTEELQRSRQNLVSAREDERRRLRRDLHDGLGPEIAAFSFRIESARNLLKTDPCQTDAILNALQLEIRDAVDSIRCLVHNLRPPALDQYGLAEAVTELVRMNKGSGLDITVEIPRDFPVFSAAVEVAAYRIVQEGLANVARHARAENVRITLFAEEKQLVVIIIDDGVGFPPVRLPGVGLTSMRERAEELGGTFIILNRPESGTIIRAELPYVEGGESHATTTSATG